MSDDEYPNLGGAANSTSLASAASWNPAFRPDSHRDHAHILSTASNDDSLDEDVYHVSETSQISRDEALGESEESRSPIKPSLLSVEHAAYASEERSNLAEELAGEKSSDTHLDQALLQQEFTPTQHQEGIQEINTAAEFDEEAVIFQPDESIQEQEAHLENSLLPGTTKTVLEDTEAGLEDDTGYAYEHQGEMLDLEEAIDEAPSAPLLEDPEEPPVVEELKREPTLRAVEEDSILDLDAVTNSAQSQSNHKSHPSRSFTTNFTDLPNSSSNEAQSQENIPPVSAGWPSAGDDKTFGELLGEDDSAFNATSKEAAEDVLHNSVDDDWAGADDNAFGELLGDQSTFLEEAAQEPAKSAASGDGEQDLAAIWQAALDDDDLLDDPNDLDPSAFFGDDDEGFLEDDLQEAAQPSMQQQPQSTATSYIPAAAQQTLPHRSAHPQYTAQSSTNLSQNHGRSVGTPSTGLYDVYGHNATMQPQPPQRPSAQSAQSFVDKAKGGYQSPYDLPMEVVKQTRPRPRQAQTGPQAVPVAPPRSSSMSSQSGAPQLRPSTATSGASMSPPASSGSLPPVPPPTSTNGIQPPKSTSKGDSGFFADLPMAPKPRSRMSGAYTPQLQSVPTPPPEAINPQAPRGLAGPPQLSQRAAPAQVPSQQQQYNNFGGLSRPERLPLLPDQPTATPTTQSQAQSGPAQSQRYSPSSLPAPTQSQSRFSPAPPSGPPSTGSRYSPAPAAQVGGAKKYSISGPSGASAPPGIQNSHPFAPRTSSPLAFSTEKAQAQSVNEFIRQVPQTPVSPPKFNGLRSPSSTSIDYTSSLSSSPNESRLSLGAGLTSPPQRAVTQSPPTVTKSTRYSLQTNTGSSTASVPVPTSTKPTNFLPHRRQFSRDLNFTAPNDEHAHDPLQRWRGAPVFRWGDSGSIVSSIPKQIPFYAAGHGIPSVKCTPGSINIEQASSFMPMDERNAKFPGPLAARAKGRKKEVLAWMAGKVEDLERGSELVRMNFEMDIDLKKRTEEKLVLWKLMKIFVEHDGKLEGDKKIEDEIRTILLPDLAQMGQGADLQTPSTAAPGLQGGPIDRSLIIQLRQALLEGNRERAVWLAEENKLWGHAMLIASTMSPDIWKQIIQSFVRSQVKTVGSDARSLAALYQVFAGNAEECVDELVPPSARAGFQMISKSDGTIAGNPLEGLDQWRETLGLVAGNRTPSDQSSLLALGKLLSHYGRAEAAHSCFLFARQLVKHSGADDSDASFVILGANYQGQKDSGANDLDAIILTEIYEWACSLSSSSNAVHYIPHLQSFKLIHAQELAACGLKSQAQAYCDHITSAYTSTTRPSPYYHPTFTQSVNDLSAFLSQTPQTGSAGLLSKGAMNKVSSGAASWFTKFVSGDDDRESASSGPGAGENGPFGRVSGDSPGLSRSGSQAELYNPMTGGGVPFASAGALGSPPQRFSPGSAPSRYAPIGGANKYAPMSTGGLIASTRSASPSRPASSRSYAPTGTSQPLAVPRPDTGRSVSDYSLPQSFDSRRGSAQYPGSQGSYEPRPSLSEDTSMYGYQPQSPEPPKASFDDPPHVSQSINGLGLQNDEAASSAEDGGYEAPSTGYEPPSSGYEPPSYQPYQPEPENDAASPPKKKSFMDDDDDDFAKQAAAMKKAEADRQADEAFKKAAEADAARDKSKGGAKKGWLGGWFGGRKEGDLSQPGPIKAKLGEENSFYYDENLKKWVNKKGGPEAATAAAATPPPPRGPASRAVSGAMGPPSGPPSRVASAAGPPSARIPSSSGSAMGSPSMGPPSGPPSRIGTPADGNAPPMPAAVAALSESGTPSAPPSRPGTGMSSASSLDDLLGGPPGPGQRKAGGTMKGKKKGARYVDVMQAG